jgi:hypothetical protein
VSHKSKKRLVAPPSTSKSRWIVATTFLFLAIVGIATRIHLNYSAKQKLAEMYPKLEQLLAVYSVLSWRSNDQRPPMVAEKSETTGGEFTLNCPKIAWGKGGHDRTDSLFSCFGEPRKVYVPEEGKEVETIQLISAEEYSYKFAWDTVFGYELAVSLDGYEAFEKGSLIAQDREACLKERESYRDGHAHCRFNMYQVKLSGLSVSKSVSFITANGTLSWNPDGSVQRRDERVIYFDQNTPITIGQLNAVIQRTLRALGIAEQDVSKIGPQLETLWMGKDGAFLRALVAEIDKVPDLTKLSGFLQGK